MANFSYPHAELFGSAGSTPSTSFQCWGFSPELLALQSQPQEHHHQASPGASSRSSSSSSNSSFPITEFSNATSAAAPLTHGLSSMSLESALPSLSSLPLPLSPLDSVSFDKDDSAVFLSASSALGSSSQSAVAGGNNSNYGQCWSQNNSRDGSPVSSLLPPNNVFGMATPLMSNMSGMPGMPDLSVVPQMMADDLSWPGMLLAADQQQTINSPMAISDPLCSSFFATDCFSDMRLSVASPFFGTAEVAGIEDLAGAFLSLDRNLVIAAAGALSAPSTSTSVSPSSSSVHSTPPPPSHSSTSACASASAINRPFSCQGCSKTFPSLSSLRKHFKTHTKPFNCPFCSHRQGSKRDLLERHVWVHHRTEALASGMESPEATCPELGCAKMMRRDNMTRHIRTKHPHLLAEQQGQKRRGDNNVWP